MTVVTEIAIFDLLPGVDLLSPNSSTIVHLKDGFNILEQAKGFIRLFWVT